jgi:exosortase A
MHADYRIHAQLLRTGRLTPQRAFAVAAGVLVLVALVYAATGRSMVETWWRSETFAHGFLVVPAALAFMWMRRMELAMQPMQPAPLALLGVVAASALWLAGELASALVLSQLAVVAMVPFALAALAGWNWVRTLAFPLTFLFFAVPFGEVLVPTLIDWTANFTVAAIAASGVPVYREANTFVIPTGRWSVVEACSGIRYLIASVMLGSLYAWLMYRSARRRALFIAAAIVVPLVANWLRAYGIVMMGHLSNNRIAADVDHLIYGWLFFGAVMAVMFAVGTRWREDGAGHQRDRPVPPAAASMPPQRWLASAALVVAALLLGPLAAASLERSADRRPLVPIELSGVNGWSEGLTPVTAWRPRLTGTAAQQTLTYTKDGREVSVLLGVYRNQRQGSELVNSANRLIADDDSRWQLVERGTVQFEDALGRYRVHAAALRAPGGKLATAHWYWLHNARTISDVAATADLALDRLLMRGDTAVWVTVVTPARDGLPDALPVLRGFVADMGAELDRALTAMAER